MNAESFSLKARRTTRVPLRIPVQVTIKEADQAKAVDGWTVLVNIHGAKIECKRRMQVGDTVSITVLVSHKTQSGNIVWSAPEASANGYFEFAVELNEPGNLWGVGFPPSDWKEVRAGAGPVAVAVAAASTEPNKTITSEKPVTQASAPEPKKIVIPGYEMKPIVPFTVAPVSLIAALPAVEPPPVAEIVAESIAEPIAKIVAEMETPVPTTSIPELQEMLIMVSPIEMENVALPWLMETSPVEMVVAPVPVDFRDDINEWMKSRGSNSPLAEPVESQIETVEPIPVAAASEIAALAPSFPEIEQQLTPSTMTIAQPEPIETIQKMAAVECETTLVESAATIQPSVPSVAEIMQPPMPESAPLPISVAAPPLPMALSTALPIPLPMAMPESTPAHATSANDRFSALLNEMVESALQARVEGLIDRAGARLESRMAEVEASAMERTNKRISTAAEDHYERLDQHSESMVAARRIEFEQGLAKFAEASEAAATRRQHEMVSLAEQDLRRQAIEVSDFSRIQAQRQAVEIAETTQLSLATKIQEMLPKVEQGIAEKCSQQTEQIIAQRQTQFEAMLAAKIEAARAYWQEQMTAMQTVGLHALKEKLDDHIEQCSTIAVQQMELRMAHEAARVQESLLKHIIAELSAKQKMWMEKTQRDMNHLADVGARQVRLQLSQVCSAISAALVQDDLFFSRPSAGIDSIATEPVEAPEKSVSSNL